MSDYFQLKNSSVLTPPAGTNLGTSGNPFANAYVATNLTVGGTTVNSATISSPRITGVVYSGDDQAIDILGGTITINGVGFQAGCQVLVNQSTATSITYVSSTQLIAVLPAMAAGSYIIYVSNPDGSLAIRVNGVSYSGLAQWLTSNPLPEGVVNNAISIQFAAIPATSYVLTPGYTLPPGLTLTSGGLLSGTVTGITSYTTYNFNVTAIDAEYQDSPRAFTISINIGDPYFKYTTLLLNGENAAIPYNSDVSYNNFLISPTNGAVVPSVATPYQAGYYSNYFNGSTDYCTVPSETSVAFGSAAYTVEFWIYKTSLAKAEYIIGGTNTVFQLGINTSGQITPGPAGGTALTVSTGTVPLNQWVHVAVVRTSTSTNGVAYYINGVAAGTATDANSYSSTGVLNIGTTNSSTTYCVSGYISNLRVVNGSAVYPSAFTPNTAPLTAIANTSLLTCQSYRFLDNSTNNFTLTAVGTPSVTPQQPFTLPSTWANFGSSYFDGNSALTTAANAAFNLSTGAPNFTIEFWLYVPNTTNVIYINKDGVSGSNWGSYIIQITSANTMMFLVAPNSGNGATSTTGTVVPNTWTHVAAVRNGNNIQLYLNGVLAQSSALGSMVDGGGGLMIGKNNAGTPYYAVGNMCNLRIVKGVAVYTGNFTPPTIAPLAISGPSSIGCYPSSNNINTSFDASVTSLLTLQTPQASNNNIFRDSSLNNLLVTRVGTPTQGTFSPFSQTGWSGYFDGSSWLAAAASSGFAFDTGDFTIEAWITIGSAVAYSAICGTNTNGNAQAGTWWAEASNTRGLAMVLGSATVTFSATFVPGTTYHIAFTRSSGQVRAFVNGVQQGTSAADSTNLSSAVACGIGNMNLVASSQRFNGNISNLRIIKGQALSTTNFTPPTSPVNSTQVGWNGSTTALTGTCSLLTLQSNRFIDNSANNLTLTPTGTPSIQAFSPFNPTSTYSFSAVGGSAYADTTGQYLTFVSNILFQLGTAAFTLECWVYSTASTATSVIFVNTGSNTAGFYTLLVQSGVTPTFGYYNGSTRPAATGPALSLNTWNHIAISRIAGGSLTVYTNGIAGTTVDASTWNLSAYDRPWIYANPDATGERFSGYISNLRLVKGAAVYTGAFTPPTSPLQLSGAASAVSYPSTTNVNTTFNQGQTSLLLNFTAGGIVDATAKNDLITVNTMQVSTAVTKFGSSTLKFNGSTDYITIPTVQFQNYAFGTGDFTIECWINTSVFTSDESIINSYTTWPTTVNFQLGTRAGTPNILIFRGGDSIPITINGNTSLLVGVWQHVAVTRSSGVTRMFVDGVVQTATHTGSVNISPTVRTVTIGKDDGAGSGLFNGCIEDLRVTKGYARYTTSFTPPTAPFPVR